MDKKSNKYEDYKITKFQSDSYYELTDENSKLFLLEKKYKELASQLEAKVEERTRELNDTLNNLTIANYELNELNHALSLESQKLLKLNDKLLDSEYKLNQALDSKNKFFSIIAHDLINPVFGLMQLIDLLHSEFENDSKEEIESFLSTISQASKSVFELLQNLLLWARSQTDRIEFQPEPQNLKELIDTVINMIEPASKAKNIKIHNNINLSLFGLIDTNMIRTVLRNLISNSIKFSFPGQEINLNAQEQGNQILISVKDHGIGMDNEHLKMLFKIDFKPKTPGTNNERGTGLGLIICKEFIEKHDGIIWVESQENHGSTFYFSIPKFSQT